MRKLVRPIVVGAFILPLSFAGAGLASADHSEERGGPSVGGCQWYSCSYWYDPDYIENDNSTSFVNAGIIG